MIEILRTDSNNDCFINITKQLDNELYTRYGSFQSKYDEYNIVGLLDTVVIGFIDNVPAGCGCFKSFDRKTAEIKRMMVLPEFRGSGLATIILSELEKWAIEKDFSSALLQTGIKQPDAIRFYTRNGYNIIDNYGQYEGDDNSVCMKKIFKT
jgi:GNAT superfamily N-acetyltransferase